MGCGSPCCKGRGGHSEAKLLKAIDTSCPIEELDCDIIHATDSLDVLFTIEIPCMFYLILSVRIRVSDVLTASSRIFFVKFFFLDLLLLLGSHMLHESRNTQFQNFFQTLEFNVEQQPVK
eukprot:6443774-Amphidinium_carterae.1